MSALAVLLIAVGLADLVAGRPWSSPLRGRRVGALVGLASIGLLAGLGDLSTWGDLGLLAIAALTTGAWVVLAGRADDTDRQQGWALAALGVGAGTLILLGGAASPMAGGLARWLHWSDLGPLATIDPTRAALLLGLLLVQLSTGNMIVRLVLAHTGALNPLGGPQPSDRLRGGRLLGPMERVFILGLGLAGQVTAASIVIAAKGLIRWPELQKASREGRSHPDRDEHGTPTSPAETTTSNIDQVTEYFLIGSFMSWLVALGALALAHLT